MKGNKPKFDELAVKKIVEWYESGEKSVAHIAKEMKTTAATVRKYLKKEGKYIKRKIKKATGRGKPAAGKAGELQSEIILRELRAAEARLAQLKKALGKAIEKEEKRFTRLKMLAKS